MKREVKEDTTKSLNLDFQKKFGNMRLEIKDIIKESLNQLEPEQLRKLIEFS